MDVMDLLKNVPGLLDSVQEAGVPQEKISDLGAALGEQLGGADGFDLTDLIAGLDLDSFFSKVDAGSLSERLGLSPEIIQEALQIIGPKVAEFSPGGLGSLAGKLFR